jgi:hypothetical protein
LGEPTITSARRDQVLLRFWRELLHRAIERTDLHAGVAPRAEIWIGAAAGKPGLHFSYAVLQHEAKIDLVIETSSAAVNRRVFDELLEHKDAIEAAYGGRLEWAAREGTKRCRIADRVYVGGYRDVER